MIQFEVLGPLGAIRDGERVRLAGARQRAVLARLVVAAPAAVSADAIVEDVWEGDPPPTAHKTLQKYVSELRKQLGADVIRTTSAGYALDVPEDAVDGRRFERLVRDGEPRAALALWRGEPLGDLGSPAFAVAERCRLGELRLHALEARIADDVGAGRAAAAAVELAELTEAHPLREELVRLRMLALYRTGRHVEALRCFEHHRRRLADEIGVEPGADLRELEAAILRHDASLTAGRGPARPAAHVPVPLTSFVGRAEEVAAVTSLLGAHRVVTVTGPGGIGKTRLAVAVAQALAPTRPGGTWLVDLAAVRSADLVADATAAAMAIDVREAGDAGRALAASVADRPAALVVLDNCEHVVDAAAAVASTLVRASTEISVLATSRRPLGVDGEYVAPLGPLADDDVVDLFVDRARFAGAADGIDPGSDEVAAICACADGLPLAVELAASQLRVLGVAEVAARLQDRLRFRGRVATLPRQRTLHEMVAWSHGLLPDGSRDVFATLGVFASSFTLTAAEAVCSACGVDVRDVLGHVSTLVDHSLLARHHHPAGTRYRMLETLRLYAVEQLDATEHGARARRAHARHYRDLAATTGPRLYGPDEVAQRLLLEAEEPNIHAALAWAASADRAMAFELAIALWPYWDVRWGERAAVAYLEGLLAAASPDDPPCSIAWVLTAAADLAANPGDARRSIGWAERAVALFRDLDDERGLAHALVALGSAYVNEGRLGAADGVLGDAVRLARELGDRLLEARCLNFLSHLADRRGEHEAAAAIATEEVEQWRALGSRRGEATGLRHLAVHRLQLGDPAGAEALCRRALVIWEELDDAVSVAHLETTLADVARVQGDAATAAERYQRALPVLRSVGDRRCTASTLRNLALLDIDAGRSAVAEARLRRAMHLRHELGDDAGVPECIEGLALCAAADGDDERAVELASKAARMRAAASTAPAPYDVPRLSSMLDGLRSRLGPARFAEVGARSDAGSSVDPLHVRD